MEEIGREIVKDFKGSVAEDNNMAIPKIIHYCWYGNKEIPDHLKKCMESWKILEEHGYQIKRWDESNCGFDECDFIRKAYQGKKYEFIADYYRAKVLYEEGGIYLDTDVVINKPFDELLDQKAFAGFFYNVALCTAVVGSEKGGTFIKRIKHMYESGEYETEETVIHKQAYKDVYQGKNWQPNNEYWTWCMIKVHPDFKVNNKKQIFEDITIYPKEYFEIGSVFSDYYSRHINTNSWKENKKGEDSLINRIKVRAKENQKIWTIVRKIKFRKAQKVTSFYRNRKMIGMLTELK